MRRSIFTVTLLVGLLAGLLASSPSAFGAVGHNLPTKRLEGAYKFALQDRRFDPKGCYAPPAELAKVLKKATGRQVGVSQGTGSLRRLNEVYVITKGTNCNRLRMALRAVGGIYVLDSNLGTIRIQGQKGAATPGLARPLRNLSLATQEYKLDKPDTAPRLEADCPGGKFPMGGGMVQTPGVGPDGEGIYPHSYERLGAQLGYHISVVVLDVNRGGTTPRNVTVQVLCGRGVIPATPTPHKTVWIRTGQTKTVTARCPRGQFLVGGGFQRTNFRSDGGNYITESKAAGPKSWTTTGSAYGSGQGELTAIAYCARMKKPILTEVASSPAPVAAGQTTSVTTAPCPNGKRLAYGGFSAQGKNTFFADGFFNPNNTWTVRNYGFFGPSTGLTAYGYCLPARG